MSEREIIETQIRKKASEVQGLEERLKAAKIYIKALEDVLAVIDRGRPTEESEGETTLRRGSAVARAREVILERGTPIHIDDLLEALGRDVTRETKASLTGSIAAYVRKGEIFTRPAPSTFGLVELSHHEVPEEEEQPPSGFGAHEPPDESPFAASTDDEIPF